MGQTKSKRRPTHPPVTRVDASNITPPPQLRPVQKPPPKEPILDFWPAKWAKQEDFWRGITANLITAYVIAAIGLELTNVARVIYTNQVSRDTVWPTFTMLGIAFAFFYIHVKRNSVQRRGHAWPWRRKRKWTTFEEIIYRLMKVSFVFALFLYVNISIIYRLEALITTFANAPKP